MGYKRGRPRHLAQAVYTQKRRSQGATQGLIAQELSTEEHSLQESQIQRWEKEDFKGITDFEAAKVLGWADGLYGWTKAHEVGRPEFRIHLQLDKGNAQYLGITLEESTPWKELALRS